MKYIPILSLAMFLSCNTGDRGAQHDMDTYSDTKANDILKDRGRHVLQQRCASCHNVMKETTGPALNEHLISDRSDGWIDTFFNHRSYLLKDKALKTRMKTYGFICPAVSLGRTELQQLLAYLRDPVQGCLAD